ncbi:hypothetical protein CAPTEDRAFT_215528 [Capitella teleta]|uniref:EF-hand domain-containing protein n=1 Tax=Capitella teleta TaxID=283909 RepID=R7TMC8_CAPTE|nr:hypothetical protein CAPTEDRAFT_215528 [Capitella teleta]|eukprot:ELT95003.1 hypothetical protein CAPTEDRAFT_215528 [Capitella teleta]
MSGKLGIDESRDLWENLLSWKAYFTRYDVDGNGFFREMNSARFCQIKLSPATKTVLSRRFSDKENRVWFPDYVACMVKMKSALELFDGKAKDDEDRMQLELDEVEIVHKNERLFDFDLLCFAVCTSFNVHTPQRTTEHSDLDIDKATDMKFLMIVALLLAIASCMFADVEASKQGAVLIIFKVPTCA